MSSSFDSESIHPHTDKRMVIFDFDGTLTDAEQEGQPFRAGYLDDLAVLTGWPREQIETEAIKFEAEVAANPERFGWMFKGQIVAPATVDPYLRMMPVARHLLDQAQALMTAQDRERVLDGLLYKYNYQKTVTAFRDHAGESLAELISQGHLSGEAGELFVVTNSHTEAVQHKIAQLESQRQQADLGDPSLTPLIERVFGRAQKYIVDPSFDLVPESLSLPGLDRPVLLRRKHYFEVLNRLREQAGVPWSQVWVFGDIFELDLSLPIALGASVGLMANKFTPQWELDYLAAHERGYILDSLAQVQEVLGLS